MPVKAKAGDGERPPGRAKDSPSLRDETICGGLPPHLLKVPAGIIGTAIDADTHALTIDYDPRLISDESIRQVAERLAPEAQRRFDKCVMRLADVRAKHVHSNSKGRRKKSKACAARQRASSAA